MKKTTPTLITISWFNWIIGLKELFV